MLSLGTADVLNGVATDASLVTYSISGLEMDTAEPPDAVAYATLAQGDLSDSPSAIYTPGGSNSALISNIALYNSNSVAELVVIFANETAIAVVNIPALGTATYEDGAGWTVCDANGVPLSNAGGGGGGLPAWFQSGAGDPITSNPTTPYQAGALYEDTAGGGASTGLWISPTGSDGDWIGLGTLENGAVGLRFFSGDFSLTNSAGIGWRSYQDGPAMVMALEAGNVSFFINEGNPNGGVTPVNEGDICYDQSTPGVWQNTDGTADGWVQLGAPLPFLVGSGSPVGVVTPTDRGVVYLDNSDSSGMWVSTSDTNTDWIAVGGPDQPAGFVCQSTGTGTFNIAMYDQIGGGWAVGFLTWPGTSQVVTSESNGFGGTGGSATIIVNGGSPVGVITPSDFQFGDLCIDTDTPALWQMVDDDGATWQQVGGPPSLAYDGQFLAFDDSPVTPTSDTPVMDTDSLAVGTWLVTFTAMCTIAPSGFIYTFLSEAGSATIGTYTGAFQGFVQNPDAISNLRVMLNFTCILVLTEAGTLEFQASGDGASTIVSAYEGNGGTGYTAVKIG
jgi:hypothetical protein